MGRSSKKMKTLPEESNILVKTDDLKSNQTINEIIGQCSNQTFYFPKQFKYWMNSQFEIIRRSNFLSIRFNFKQNEILKFDSSVEINDLFLMSVLKDKVYQIYRQHIKESILLNETRERLKNNDYINSTADENVSQNDLLEGMIGNVVDHAKWLTNYCLNLPGFNKLNDVDFIQIINNATLFTMGIQLNEFYSNNEFYNVTKNGYQLSRNRLNLVFGSFIAYLYCLSHAKLKQLCLSDYEKALLYPVFVFSCDGIIILLVSFVI